MRAFFAVDLSGETRQNVTGFLDKCRAIQPNGVTYTAPENLHVTLKFLGDVSDDQAGKLTAETADLHRPVPMLTVSGAGAFPNAVFPKVLWIGVQDDGELAQLFEDLDEITEHHGVPRDTRPFHPHITIGRVTRNARPKRELADLVKNCRENFGGYSALEFVLYKSELTRNGPVYTKVRAYPFEGGKG